MIKGVKTKKELRREKVLDFLFDVIVDLTDEPIIFLPVFLVGLVCLPIEYIRENIVKRRLIKKYGHIRYTLKSLNNPTNTVDYLWRLRCKLNKMLKKVNSSDYDLNNGYLESSNVIKELEKLEKDHQTIEFIRNHMGQILRIKSKDALEQIIESLNNKAFNKANNLLSENTDRKNG